MKEHPILFSTRMVQAILAGRKTMTRRTNKLHNINQLATEIVRSDQWPKQGDFVARFRCPGVMERFEVTDIIRCPYGRPGDILWVRESFFNSEPFKDAPLFQQLSNPIIYRADDGFIGCHKWKPSIHMPKSVARIWLQVESIKVERLHDISNADIEREGVDVSPLPNGKTFSHRTHFTALWCTINGEASWEANPWLWVVSFKVLSTTGKPAPVPSAEHIHASMNC